METDAKTAVHPELCALLTACSRDFHERTPFLVAADRCLSDPVDD